MCLHINPKDIPQVPKSLIPLTNKAASDFINNIEENAMQGVRNSYRYTRDNFSATAADTMKPIIRNPEVFANKMPFLGKLVTKYVPSAIAILAGFAAGSLINKIIDKVIENKQKKEG